MKNLPELVAVAGSVENEGDTGLSLASASGVCHE